MQAEPSDQKWFPSSEAEKSAIFEQLDRLLLDPSFKNSKRYPSFLRFVVRQSLEGEAESLKERVLGIEVFGKPPDYDSTQDPIVRVTATEIRKRILKYYQDPLHQDEIRILLPSGTYVPHFEPAPVREPLLTLEPEPPVPHLHQPSAHRPSLRVLIAAACTLCLVSIPGVLAWRAHHRSAVDAFWAPVLDSAKPVLFCIADQSGFANVAAAAGSAPAPQDRPDTAPTLVAAEDTAPLLEFVSLVRPRVPSFRVQVEGQTNFTDLAQGPTILIGAFNNRWTMFATDPLRFHFVSESNLKRVWIEDSHAPTKRDWVLESGARTPGPRKDYALIARFIDPQTDQVTVVVAGLGHHGTSAAGTFVLSAQSLEELTRLAPQASQSRNLELVLETVVVNGHPGPAHIDAVQVW